MYGEVKPQDKLDLVNRLKRDGKTLAFAGDGINDSPALAAADVGMAMGTGTDVAINSAHVTLVKGDLRAIARAQPLCRCRTQYATEPRFFFFLLRVGHPLGCWIVVSIYRTASPPMIAALAMSLSSVSVIANALRLRGTSP